MNKDKWAGLDLKKGDRVRIVIEDEVAGLRGGLDTLCNSFHALDSHIVSIEKLKPALPTEPGTTFRARVTFQDGWDVKPYESTLFVRDYLMGRGLAYIPASTDQYSFAAADVENGSVTVEVLD